MPITLKAAPTARPGAQVDKFSALKAKAAAKQANTPADKSKRRSGHAKPRQPLISLDSPGRLYTGHVLAVAGISAASLFNRIKSGAFPQPRKDGRLNWWPTHEIKTALGL